MKKQVGLQLESSLIEKIKNNKRKLNFTKFITLAVQSKLYEDEANTESKILDKKSELLQLESELTVLKRKEEELEYQRKRVAMETESVVSEVEKAQAELSKLYEIQDEEIRKREEYPDPDVTKKKVYVEKYDPEYIDWLKRRQKRMVRRG